MPNLKVLQLVKEPRECVKRTDKRVRGDLIVRVTVKGSQVKEGQYLKLFQMTKIIMQPVATDRLANVSTTTSSSDLPLRCQRSKKVKTILIGKNNKANLLGIDRHTNVSTVTLSFDLP